MERYKPEPQQLDNKYTHSEYWPPDVLKGKDMKDLVLDTVLIGQAVLGLRALVEPAKYDLQSPFVQRSIHTAEAMGYIKDGHVEAPIDIIEIAFPSKQNKRPLQIGHLDKGF